MPCASWESNPRRRPYMEVSERASSRDQRADAPGDGNTV
jgi:hypothetical protein